MVELTALDIKYAVAELSTLSHSKINKIYQPSETELLFQLHSSSLGKQFLQIVVGKAILRITEKNISEKPSSYCLHLRKLLEGGIIESIAQVTFERIVEISIKTKQGKRKLYAELFGKGNIIITDEKNLIISTLHVGNMRNRAVKAKEQYSLPPARVNPFTAAFEEIDLAMQNGEEVVRAIANVLGLGGMMAEEICLRTGIEKKRQWAQLTKQEQKNLVQELQSILSQKLSPQVLIKEGIPVRVLPFMLRQFSAECQQAAENMSSAIVQVLAVGQKEKEGIKKKTKNVLLEKLEKIITMQEKQAVKLEKEVHEEHRKGELLYERYQEVHPVLETLKNALKKNRLKEEAAQYGIVIATDSSKGTATINIE